MLGLRSPVASESCVVCRGERDDHCHVIPPRDLLREVLEERRDLLRLIADVRPTSLRTRVEVLRELVDHDDRRPTIEHLPDRTGARSRASRIMPRHRSPGVITELRGDLPPQRVCGPTAHCRARNRVEMIAHDRRDPHRPSREDLGVVDELVQVRRPEARREVLERDQRVGLPTTERRLRPQDRRPTVTRQVTEDRLD